MARERARADARALVSAASASCGTLDAESLCAALAHAHVARDARASVALDVIDALPPCSGDVLRAVLGALPPSVEACAAALELNAKVAACGGAQRATMPRAVVAFVRTRLPDVTLGHLVRAIGAPVVTRAFAEELVRADMRCLEHFTNEQADHAGARVGGTMHTVLPLADIREDVLRAELGGQRRHLEGVWESARFKTLASRLASAFEGRSAPCVLHTDAVYTARSPDVVAALHGTFVLNGLGAAWAPKRRAPCTERGLSRRALRWVAAFGDARARREVGREAFGRNDAEGFFVRALRGWGEGATLDEAVALMRRTKASSLARTTAADYTVAVGKHAEGASARHVRAFVSTTRWRLGTAHAASVCRYVCLPFVSKVPTKIHFVRVHPVLLAMPPRRVRWVRACVMAMARAGLHADVRALVIANVRWREIERRACVVVRECFDHDYDYT